MKGNFPGSDVFCGRHRQPSRVRGKTRECFYNCVEFLDEAIWEISVLDGHDDLNYIKKHTSDGVDAKAEAGDVAGDVLGIVTGTGTGSRARIFSIKPGVRV